MATLTLFDKKGKKAKKGQDINDALFSQEANEHLIYLAKVRQEANARAGTAHTLTRSEVRGGGAKPFRQKGTGRARAGSRVSPLWKGGGIMHGPRNTVNWTRGMNKKEKSKALLSALILQNNHESLFAIEELALEEAKSKELANLVKELDFAAETVLFVIDTENEQAQILKRCSRNIVRVKVITVNELNAKDLTKATKIVATSKAIAQIEERFSAFAVKEEAAA